MMLPFILSCLKPLGLNAQSFTTQGTDFWAALMPNWYGHDIDNYYISASGTRTCSVTVSNPNSGWTHTFAVPANSITTYQMPSDQCWEPNQFGIIDKGLHIVSTDTVQIWIYNQNGTPSTCDATQILPTSSLSNEYIVQSTPVDHCSTLQESRSQFSVLAPQDSTIVDLVLTNSTATGIAAGTSHTFTLNAGQILQVQGPLTSGDFSGTRVNARNCKPIAVFSGASTTSMPDVPSGSDISAGSADHTYQQNLPTAAYSTEWLLTPTAWHDTSDFVRITSKRNNCQVRCNGTLIATLNSGETYQFKLTSAAQITTSRPAVLYQYLDSRHSHLTGGDWGDVAMFAPNNANQKIQWCCFPTFPLLNRPNYDSKYYVNIIVPTAETSLLLLDGFPLTDYHPISGTAYSYSRHPINQSIHTIFTTGSGFSAYTYGLAENWEAYAMSLGGTDTATHISSNIEVTIDTGTCRGHLWWHDTLLLAPSTAQITVPDFEGICDSVYTIHLSAYPSYSDTIDSLTCFEQLLWDDTLLSTPGTYYFQHTTIHGCDSTILLNLHLKPTAERSLDTACCSDTLHIQQYALAVPGDHTVTLTNPQGCDSIIHLHVDALPRYNFLDTVYVNSNGEHWNYQGQQYSAGDVIDDTLITVMGCDSIIHITVLANTDTSCQHHLWVPNIFTPLLDGNNQFRVLSDNVTKMEVNIFQRWGDWVCTFDGLTEGWDGTKNSSPCPAGTYVYLIRYATPCQSNVKPIVGTVTLIR